MDFENKYCIKNDSYTEEAAIVNGDAYTDWEDNEVYSGDIAIEGSLYVTSYCEFIGNVEIKGDLVLLDKSGYHITVTGNLKVGGNIQGNESISVNGNLEVTGNVDTRHQISAKTAEIKGHLNVQSKYNLLHDRSPDTEPEFFHWNISVENSCKIGEFKGDWADKFKKIYKEGHPFESNGYTGEESI
jgi:predicted acyltransferase (DUF342 family)